MKTLLCASALTLAAFAASAQAADYSVDPAHSSVSFTIGHLGTSVTLGQFRKFSGDYSLDETNPAASSVKLTIDSASVDTNYEPRDKHLSSPDFLDVKQFPEITFTSTAYEGTADAGKLTGDMTLHGVTKPVSFDVKKIGEGKDPWGGYRSGFVATTTIKRSEFGITNFIPGVTDETDLTVRIEGVRK
ncbi:YceI family protein [Pokkaliibacter sp. CJK22405]|uniref:YceI family protein n=1 Tax=Pokkaliibacter sp. CJK22405 TaxID=3384615 RepID=UPI003985663C